MKRYAILGNGQANAIASTLPQDEALSVFHEGFDGDGDFVSCRCQQRA